MLEGYGRELLSYCLSTAFLLSSFFLSFEFASFWEMDYKKPIFCTLVFDSPFFGQRKKNRRQRKGAKKYGMAVIFNTRLLISSSFVFISAECLDLEFGKNILLRWLQV